LTHTGRLKIEQRDSTGAVEPQAEKQISWENPPRAEREKKIGHVEAPPMNNKRTPDTVGARDENHTRQNKISSGNLSLREHETEIETEPDQSSATVRAK
jgi:hypothetical protein